MAFQNDLVEIARLLGVEAAQAEVIEDEDVGRQQTTEDLFGGMIGAGLMETLQEMIGAQEAHLPTGATGGVTEGARQEGLPDPDGTQKDYVLMPVQEAEREEVADAVASDTFEADKVAAIAAERVKIAERLRDAVTKALGRFHALLEPEQRQKLAYLIRTGALTL